MSLHRLKRLMFALAAFALLSGAMVSPVRAVAAQAVADDCPAMKMHMTHHVSTSAPCKMATTSDCAKLTCCDSMPGTLAEPMAPALSSSAYVRVSYDEIRAALRGRVAEPALFPPKAVRAQTL
jgi:hypothetical protein